MRPLPHGHGAFQPTPASLSGTAPASGAPDPRSLSRADPMRTAYGWTSHGIRAFNNNTGGARYHEEAADLTRIRTVAFFKKHLGA